MILTVMLCLSGCSRIKDIRVVSCAVQSVKPVGIRGVEAELAIQIENPAMAFTLSDVSGVIYYKGRPYVNYSAEPVSVEKKTVAVYPVACSATVVKDVSFLEMLSVFQHFKEEDFTIDVHAKVTLKNGVTKGFDFKKVPVKDFI